MLNRVCMTRRGLPVNGYEYNNMGRTCPCCDNYGGGSVLVKVLRDSEENGGRKDPRGQGESGAPRGFRAPEETRDVRAFPGCAAISAPRDPVVSRGCAAT